MEQEQKHHIYMLAQTAHQLVFSCFVMDVQPRHITTLSLSVTSGWRYRGQSLIDIVVVRKLYTCWSQAFRKDFQKYHKDILSADVEIDNYFRQIQKEPITYYIVQLVGKAQRAITDGMYGVVTDNATKLKQNWMKWI